MYSTIKKIWNEYQLTPITERENAIGLSIKGWKDFSNETLIENWIFSIRVVIMRRIFKWLKMIGIALLKKI